jgi:hypothetical protein
MRLGAQIRAALVVVRSVINLRHTRGNSPERTEDFGVHIPGDHTPVSQAIAHILQE